MKYKYPVSEPTIGDLEKQFVNDALRKNEIAKGEYVELFERGFADYCGVAHGVSTSSGTSALHLALRVLGVGPGDEVIVPNLTFVATANAVSYCGATVVLADIEDTTWGIDPLQILKKITRKTKVIIAVHLYGQPCQIEKIREICFDYNIFLVEDCAQAHGATVNGRKVGSFGEIGCFSFYGNKIMTTGEGGMCVTNSAKLAERMKYFRDGAMEEVKYIHDEIGYNYRMTNVQAAIGYAQLQNLDSLIKYRNKVKELYDKELVELSREGKIKFQIPAPGSVCWLYSFRITSKFDMERAKLFRQLEVFGIETRPFFAPISVLPPYRSNLNYPKSWEVSISGINLPTSATMSYADIDYITDKIINLSR